MGRQALNGFDMTLSTVSRQSELLPPTTPPSAYLGRGVIEDGGQPYFAFDLPVPIHSPDAPSPYTLEESDPMPADDLQPALDSEGTLNNDMNQNSGKSQVRETDRSSSSSAVPELVDRQFLPERATLERTPDTLVVDTPETRFPLQNRTEGLRRYHEGERMSTQKKTTEKVRNAPAGQERKRRKKQISNAMTSANSPCNGLTVSLEDYRLTQEATETNLRERLPIQSAANYIQKVPIATQLIYSLVGLSPIYRLRETLLIIRTQTPLHVRPISNSVAAASSCLDELDQIASTCLQFLRLYLLSL